MLKNIIANILGRFWSIISNYLFIPFYISLLGLENYAVISFTLILIGIMSMMSSSLVSTLSREFAKHTDAGTAHKKRTLNTLELCYWAVVLVIIAGILVGARPIAEKWLTLKTLDINYVANAIKIFGIGLAFQLLGNFYMGGLIGLQHQVKANVYQIVWGIFRNGVVLVIIYFQPSLIYFFLWQLVTTVIYVFLLRRSLLKSIYMVEGSEHVKFGFDKGLLKETKNFVGGMLLISIVAAINTQLDKIAISKLMPIEQLGYYNIAISLTTALIVLVTPVSMALLPHFTALYSKQETEKAGNLFSTLFLLVAIIVFSISAILMFYGKAIILIWTGNQILADASSGYIIFSAFGTAMLATQIIPFDIAIANGYTRINNVLGIISLFISVPGYWISVSYFGPIGAAVTWCILQAVTTPIFIYFVQKRFLKDISFLKIMFYKLLIPALLAIGTAFAIFHIIPLSLNKWLNLCIISLATLVTLLVVTFSMLRVSQIKHLLSLVKNRK